MAEMTRTSAAADCEITDCAAAESAAAESAEAGLLAPKMAPGAGEKTIRAAIFDMDGTLIDSMSTWHDAGARFLRRRGITPEEGLGDKLFVMNSTGCAEYLIQTYGLSMSTEEVARGLSEEMREFYTNEAEYRPGAKELLDGFRRAGIPMVVLTSTDGYLVEIALRRVGALDYFQHIYSSGDLQMSKGEPEIFQLALSGLGAEAAETAVFEDGLYAIRTANSAGFLTAGIRDVVSDAEQGDIREESDWYVRDLREFQWNETEKKLCITKF